MDKNTLWGFVLIGLVVIGFSWLNRPSEEEIAARKAEQERMEQAYAESQKAAQQEQQVPEFISNEPDTTVILENELLSLNIGSRGANINSAILKDYYSYAKGNNDSVLVNLIHEGASSYGFTFTTASRRFDTANYQFKPTLVNDSVVEMTLDFSKILQAESKAALNDTSSIVNDSLQDIAVPDPSLFTIRYTLKPQSYIVTMEVLQQNMQEIVPSSTATANFDWKFTMMRNELGRTFEENKSSLSYKFVGDSPDELSPNKKDTETLRQRVKWIAFKNQFFSIVSLPRTHFNSAEISSESLKDSPEELKDLSYSTTIDYSSLNGTPFTMDLFIGPNLYPLLSSLDDHLQASEGLQLTRLIPLGWPIIRWINTLIIIPVFTWLGTFISNYGIIILLLTIFIKIIIYPFTYKSFISQAKMRLLSPEIKEINDKYPGQQNAAIRSQKTMAVYSRAGASPMAGCVPMLFQMPVLFAMFWFFPSCIELRGKSFLWAHNLAAPDYICTLPFKIPFYGDKVSLFCLLMTVFNILYTRLNMQNSPSNNSMPGMKLMMYFMPLMFLFFFNDYASGLSYYYLLSLFISIAMTYIFRACVNEDKLRKKMMENAAKPRKKSGLMARLEEMQRQQQAALREQQKRKGR